MVSKELRAARPPLRLRTLRLKHFHTCCPQPVSFPALPHTGHPTAGPPGQTLGGSRGQGCPSPPPHRSPRGRNPSGAGPRAGAEPLLETPWLGLLRCPDPEHGSAPPWGPQDKLATRRRAADPRESPLLPPARPPRPVLHPHTCAPRPPRLTGPPKTLSAHVGLSGWAASILRLP